MKTSDRKNSDGAMKSLLLETMHEIRTLRRQNEILSAKVEMIDLFATVLYTKPHEPIVGMSEDVAWKLQRAIDQVDSERSQ